MDRTLHLLIALALVSCTVQRAEPVRVSRETIGRMRLDRPLGELRRLTPGSRDTTVTTAQSTWPGVVFRLPDLTIVARQHRDSLDPSLPADTWTLSGCGGELPNAVPLCANWQELTRAFGDSGTGSTATGTAVVRLCGLPGFEFELDVGAGTVGSLETERDLSRVPATARVERVTLARRGAGCVERSP